MTTASRKPPSPEKVRLQPLANGKSVTRKRQDYGSEGVRDNDIFLLPASDYQIMGALMLVGAVVRLFRIYQPTSVVFDEVQYVTHIPA